MTELTNTVALPVNTSEQPVSGTDATVESTVPMGKATGSVLNNDELLSLIFSEFLPSDPTTLTARDLAKGRKQLLHLALAGKPLTEAALGRLWACLDSLMPLLRLLPNLRLLDERYCFDGDILKNPRFWHYARKVRIFNFRWMEHREFAQPGARTSGRYTDPYAHVVTSLGRATLSWPATEIISITGHVLCQPTFVMRSILHVEQCSEFVRHLRLEHDIGEANSPGLAVIRLTGCILRFTELRTLSLKLPGFCLVPQGIVDIVQTLTKLKSLTLDVHFPNHRADNRMYSCSASALGSGLEELETVHLFNRSSHGICGCHPTFLLEKTTRLSIMTYVRGLHSPDHFEALGLTIARKLPVLKRIDLIGYPRPALVRVPSILEAEALRRLLTHAPILELHVEPEVCINYPQVDEPVVSSCFTRAAAGRLTSLSLPPLGPIGLDSLIYFADNFKQLKDISITLNSQSWAESSHRHGVDRDRTLAQQWPSKPCATLRTLTVYDYYGNELKPRELTNVAELVDLLFPNLEAILPYPMEDPTWTAYTEEVWPTVERLRKMYQTLRLYRSSSC